MIERIGNCRVLEEVGAGGMAVVYKAVQEPLERIVAIKALKTSMVDEQVFVERFEREARFMATFQQENIINVYDYVRTGGTLFIIMEYVQGVDLYDILEKTGILPIDVAAIVALQVARALNHAHFRGIIHRDIKPANIMISTRGEVKLMDFGIAHADNLTDLTETGTGLGTPSYMSPEQILGEKLDGRTDIWSLGVVLYQMLTGKKPFIEDNEHSVLQKIRVERYVPSRRLNPEVPRLLERILGRCLAKHPDDRYPSAQGLIHELEDFIAARVQDYNARMVVFLKDSGEISEEVAASILGADAGGGARQLAFAENRTPLRSVVILHAIVLLVMVIGGAIIALVYGDTGAQSRQNLVGLAVSREKAGFLRVMAEPWAHVFVDGEKMETTPFAYSIPLTPGVHYLELQHPILGSVRREIVIKTGKTNVLVEKMETARSTGGLRKQ